MPDDHSEGVMGIVFPFMYTKDNALLLESNYGHYLTF